MLKGIDENTVVHCPTLELAEKVLAIAHSAGLKWLSDKGFNERTFWAKYVHLTCYNLLSGTFSDKTWYKNNGTKIITAEEFIKLNSFPEKWAIKLDSQEVVDYFTPPGAYPLYTIQSEYYAHFPTLESGYTLHDTIVQDYTEITLEQFREHVLKQDTMKKETYPVTREQLKEIHDIACASWKTKIAKITLETLGSFESEGELTEEIVNEMRSAATPAQRPVIDRIFPPRKKKVKKQFVGYMNIYPYGEKVFHPNVDDAESNASPNAIAVAVRVTGEYEVEE